jgi:ferredoxin-NADP reductase
MWISKRGNATEEVLITDQSATLLRREEIAEGTMAFHFETPSGFSFGAVEFADVPLTDPLKTGVNGNTRTFSIPHSPFASELVFTTRMRDIAFSRSLKRVQLTVEEKIGPATCPFALHKDLAKPAICPVCGSVITPFLSMAQQADRDRRSQHLSLLYSDRRPEDAAFLDTLKALEKINLNFSLIGNMTEISKSKKSWKGHECEEGKYVQS